MTQPAILLVGRFYCDLIFSALPRLPTLGTEVFADGFSTHAGGGAFITAAHLASLGHAASLAAMLPPAPFADLVRRELDASGVELSLSGSLETTDGPQLTVAMARRSERAFLSRRSGPPFPRIGTAEMRERGFRHLHIGELASAVDRPEIVESARAAGMTVSLDCGWDDGLRAEAVGSIIASVDVFLPNASEHKRLLDIGVGRGLAPITVIKRGSAGSTAATAGGEVSEAVEPLPAVDTTGAGDAFNAGFLSAWLGHAPLADCLKAGNSRGALVVGQRGGFCGDTLPRRDVAKMDQ